MLSAITMGLRALQMILAVALLGLSISLLAQKICETHDLARVCIGTVLKDAKSAVRYSVFLGAYGIVVSAIGALFLFVDRIPTIIPLVGDGLGALFYLSGGIAWVVAFRKIGHCDNLKSPLIISGQPVLVYKSTLDRVVGACRQCEAEHGLVWVLFAFTTSLVICDYFRRRDQEKSLR